jgi:hypothetical protein
VAADTLFAVLNDRMENKDEANKPTFPLIQGLLTFDTPYNGLARSMFVYGAFSNYQKVSSVFNVMTAIYAAAPSQIRKLAMKRGARSAIPAAGRSSTAWKGWQLIAVRTGTVGAIAAGGVTAYMHREKIMEGMKSMKNMSRESLQQSVKEGYQQSVDALGQGLAYINRGNVGRSFEYLSDHFTFVGALMKQQELSRRLDRMGELKGVGIHDFYTSLGENGVWSGGYFVPERTFCAIPDPSHSAHHLFSRQVIKKTEDEIQAHISMFRPDRNPEYEAMTENASNLVIKWFNDDSEIVDDPKFMTPPPPDPIEEPVATTENGEQIPRADKVLDDADTHSDDSELPDESPLDIAAAASMVALPKDEDGDDAEDETSESTEIKGSSPRRTYMRYLFEVAQQAGTGIKSYVPRNMPDMPQMPSGPSFKSYIPNEIPSMPSMPNLTSINVFSRKQKDTPDAGSSAEQSQNAAEGGATVEGVPTQAPAGVSN